MNRIILIGNGFDLAHRLETSYKQFIDYLWREKIIKDICNPYREMIYSNYGITIKNCPASFNSISYNGFKDELTLMKLTIQFDNKFLGKITEIVYNQNDSNPYKDKKEINWVDIEIEYYDSLKQIIIPNYESKSDPNNNFKYENITNLNNDFDKIKEYLIEYLRDVIKNNNINISENIHRIIYSYIKYQDFNENILTQKAEQEYKKLEEGRIEKSNLWNSKEDLINYLRVDANGTLLKELPENILFLNFNYTTLEKKYCYEIEDRPRLELVPLNLSIIHIHGSIDNIINEPIIFGYGDEMDTNYITIVENYENEYLENLKSYKYSETNNYKNLLEFINKDEYQLFLFGHSCGISDRVLLNMLFEHKNCVSIKPFYYKFKENYENENEIVKDNYKDVIRNISRHFNDRTVRRDNKIVSKVYCEPLVE